MTSEAIAVNDPNLVAYWKMDESWGNIAADVSGHDYDGELGDDRFYWEMGDRLITWVPSDGNIGGAARFGDANHCYITAQDMDDANYYPEPIDPCWSEGTVTMWLKLKDPQPTDRRDSNMRFAHGTGSGGRRRIWFYATAAPANRQLNAGVGGDLQWQTNIATLALENWYYVALTWDNYVNETNGVASVYVKGGDDDVNAVHTEWYWGMNEFMSNVVIGNTSTGSQGPSDGSQSFCGLLDEQAIWNVAKTAPEIVALFNTGVTQPTFTRATEPNPGRGDFDVGPEPNNWPDPNLLWVAGVGATSHDVYFGPNETHVTNGTGGTFMGNQLGTDFDPGVLALDGTYYWRIDEQPGPVTGRVWSFTIHDNRATGPDPEDDDDPPSSDQTPPDANLSWVPGDYVGSHEVFLGTDYEDVNLATSPTGYGSVCGDDPNRYCYNPPGDLTMGQTYYWRVDEVNSVYGTVKGDIWGFKVYQYIAIDDFESYAGTTALRAVWTKSKKAHSVALETSDEDEAMDSNQSMRLVYLLTGSPYYAEAYRTVPDSDLTKAGLAKAISLWYRSESELQQGCTTLDFGDVYVTLVDNSGDDTDTVRLSDEGEDPCLNAEWHEWNIDLRDFNNPDLDITDISKIILGVGDGSDIGIGYVYFDEIRQYGARCVSDLVELDGDINEDCVVNFEDIEDMGGDWLISDSNSIGFDGVLDSDVLPPPGAFLSPGGWVVDPCRGNSLRFDGHEDTTDDSNDWVDIDDYLLPRFQNRTIMTWVRNKSDDQEESYRVHIFSSTSYTIGLNIGAAGGPGSTREGNLEGRLEDCKMMRIDGSHMDVNDWHHAAFVIGNNSGDEYVYCQLYLDGVMIADNTGFGHGSGSAIDLEIPRHTGTRLPNANIGSYEDGESRYLQATLDNFRIYDYNMPAADIDALYQLEKDHSTNAYKEPNLILWYKFDETSGYIAEDSGRDKDEHIYHPIVSSANIVEKPAPKPPYDPDNKDIVNFVDYDALADDWLVEKLWPEP